MKSDKKGECDYTDKRIKLHLPPIVIMEECRKRILKAFDDKNGKRIKLYD